MNTIMLRTVDRKLVEVEVNLQELRIALQTIEKEAARDTADAMLKRFG